MKKGKSKNVKNLRPSLGDSDGDLCWCFGDPLLSIEGGVPRLGERETQPDGEEDILPELGDLC